MTTPISAEDSLRKRLLGLATSIAALALLVTGLAVASPGGIVTTVPSWNGTDYLSPYGGGGSTPTYGQTVIGTGEALQSFTFYVNAPAGDLAVRGGVGVWDGTTMTSLVWLESDFHTVTTGSTYDAVTFTPNVTLDDGVQYVIFGTALYDGLGGGGQWGFLYSGDPYPGGAAAYTNDASAPMTALTNPWDGADMSGLDMAFSMELGDATQVNRAGFCSVAGNTTPDGEPLKPGTFLDLATDQPAADPHFKGATAAFYYQGKGTSCDNIPGYTKTGEMVGYGGHGDSGGYAYMAKN
jgi:hypothetical protein